VGVICGATLDQSPERFCRRAEKRKDFAQTEFVVTSSEASKTKEAVL
jgi:hypothetical protein